MKLTRKHKNVIMAVMWGVLAFVGLHSINEVYGGICAVLWNVMLFLNVKLTFDNTKIDV